jgi:ATP-dependent Lhr-like helicase
MPVTRGEASVFLPPSGASTQPARSAAAERVLDYLRGHGASFLSDIRRETGLSLAAMNNALAELVWSGEATNDLFAELIAVKRSSRQEVPEERVRMVGPPRDPARHKVLSAVRRAIRTTPGWQGRWSAVRVPAILGEDPEPAARIDRQAAQLLARYGIVAREFLPREDLLPWAMIAGAFQRMELRGEIRRGYFVQGLSGLQFAMHEAVEEMRRVRSLPPSGRLILVNALDPANPFGPGVPLNTPPEAAGRFSRIPSQRVGLVDGEAVALAEGHGAQLWIADPSERLEELVRALLQTEKSLTIETVNGDRAASEPWGGKLKRLGLTREMDQAMRYEGFTYRLSWPPTTI